MCRGVLNLDSLEALHNFGEPLHTAEPPRHRPCHFGARGQHAVSPASLRACLGEAGPSLSGAYEKASRTFELRKAAGRREGLDEFHARERCETDETNQFLSIVAQALEEVDHLAVEVVVRFHWR